MPESKDSLPPLEALQQRIDEAKSHTGDEKRSDTSQNIGDAMRLGVELLAGIGVGGAIGYFADRWLHTFPWFFIICFFLGAAAGFRNLLRAANQMTDENKGNIEE